MYRAAVEITFHAVHALRIGSISEEPHEHLWRLHAVVETHQLDPDGLVIDFGLLRRRLQQIENPSPTPTPSTPCLPSPEATPPPNDSPATSTTNSQSTCLLASASTRLPSTKPPIAGPATAPKPTTPGSPEGL